MTTKARGTECHPNEKHYAKGLCKGCYNKARGNLKKLNSSGAERQALIADWLATQESDQLTDAALNYGLEIGWGFEVLKKATITEGNCLEWTGQVSKGGYPKTRINIDHNGKRFRVDIRMHRLLYATFNDDLPKSRRSSEGNDLVLDHVCENRRCINPRHLQVVTTEQNLRFKSGRAA